MSLLVRTLRLCLSLMTNFSQCFTSFSHSFVTMSSSEQIGVRRGNRWTRKAADQRNQNFYCEALAFSRHNINVVFDEENMKPEKLTTAPENAGIDPSTMKMRKWYLERR